jgi:hypothetical protein
VLRVNAPLGGPLLAAPFLKFMVARIIIYGNSRADDH